MGSLRRKVLATPPPDGLSQWSGCRSQKVLWCCSELGLVFEPIDAGNEFGVTNTPAYRVLRRPVRRLRNRVENERSILRPLFEPISGRLHRMRPNRIYS